jgi:crotonobetainyl-CoA:carnitine CoA-transferase CaiB-like acyl-CoA transferase
VANREPLTVALTEVLLTRGADEWFATLTGAGIPCGPINDVAQGMAFAEALGLDPVVDVQGSAQVANPLRLSATPVSYRHRPPALGENEEEILAWLDGVEGGGHQDDVEGCGLKDADGAEPAGVPG